jgi:Arm DNA-binding domain
MSSKNKLSTIANAPQAARENQIGMHPVAGAPGLYLKVAANDPCSDASPRRRSWIFRYRRGTKQNANGKTVDDRPSMGLGSLAKLSFAAACNEARRLALLRHNGADPLGARKIERAAALAASQAAAPATFKSVAETFLKAAAPTWKHRYAEQNWRGPLAKWAYPVIGDLSPNDVTVDHVLAIMNAAKDAGRRIAPQQLRERIERVLNAAAAKGLRSSDKRNPADAKLIRAADPGLATHNHQTQHYRAASANDAPAVFKNLWLLAHDNEALAAWAFMILCAARPTEALAAEWDEIGDATLNKITLPVWTIAG